MDMEQALLTFNVFSQGVTTFDDGDLGNSLYHPGPGDHDAFLQRIKAVVDETATNTMTSIQYSQILEMVPNAGIAMPNNAPPFGVNISILGPFSQVLTARSGLMSTGLFRKVSLGVRASQSMLFGNRAREVAFGKKQDDILNSFSDVIINILYNHDQPAGNDQVRILVSGPDTNAHCAFIKLLLSLDEMAGLNVAEVAVDPKIQRFMAGHGRQFLQSVMDSTMTSIYLPFPFSVGDASANIIYVSGEQPDVVRAVDMLLEFVDRIMKNNWKEPLTSTSISMNPRKLDWLLVNKKKEILHIMDENATLIAFPPVGSGSNVLTVHGANPDVLKSIRDIMEMSTNYLASLICLVPPGNNWPLVEMMQYLTFVAKSSGTEIVYKNNFIEIYGSEDCVRRAVLLVGELPALQPLIREVKFQMEIDAENRDFVSGKKNGKLNKVMKTSGCRISFQNVNDINNLLDIVGSHINQALVGLDLLKEELPADLSFFVPEMHHKRIIGVGGKNIQRVMKKYGVYVKFSSAEEMRTPLSDNVLVRTPAKNGANLLQLKSYIQEMYLDSDRNQTTSTVKIPRHWHQWSIGYEGVRQKDIQNKTGVKLQYPAKESGLDEVTLRGLDPQLPLAAQMLLDLIPEETEMRIPASNAVNALVASPGFAQVVSRLRDEFDISLVVRSTAFSPDPKGVLEINFVFLTPAYSKSVVEDAKMILTEYLESSKIPMVLQPKDSSIVADSSRRTLKKADSFTFTEPSRPFNTFHLFESKLMTGGPGVKYSAEPPPAMSVFGHDQNNFEQPINPNLSGLRAFKNSRTIGSAPNIHSFFESNHNSSPPKIGTLGVNAANQNGNNGIGNIGLNPRGPVFLRTARIVDEALSFERPSSHLGSPSPGSNPPPGLGYAGSTPGSINSPAPLLAALSSSSGAGAGAAAAAGGPSSGGWPQFLDIPSMGGVSGSHQRSLSPQRHPNLAELTANHVSMSMSNIWATDHKPVRTRTPSPTREYGSLRKPDDRLCGLSLSRSTPDILGIEKDEGNVGEENHESYEDIQWVANLIPKDIIVGETSGSEKLRNLLSALDLSRFTDMFLSQEVDYDILLTLTDDDLKELGITTFGPRRKLLNAIREINQVEANNAMMAKGGIPLLNAIGAGVHDRAVGSHNGNLINSNLGGSSNNLFLPAGVPSLISVDKSISAGLQESLSHSMPASPKTGADQSYPIKFPYSPAMQSFHQGQENGPWNGQKFPFSKQIERTETRSPVLSESGRPDIQN